MITRYVEEALRRMKYVRLEDGSYCATVPGLPGVIAVGHRRAECRRQLIEVIEEWILVRVAHGLPVPKLGSATIKVRRAG